eukprot:386987_1
MTVPTNLWEYHHPYIVLELLLSSPMECRMGMGDHLRPMIDEAIAEQSKIEEQISLIMEDTKQRIQRTQLQLKQSISASNVFNERKSQDIPVAAPLAIPPTASANSDDELNLNSYRIRMRKRPSIAQFEGVLHSRYGYTSHLMIAVD